MGNNLLISRTEYISLGGQKTIGYSIVEDRALLALFCKNKKNCTLAIPFVANAFTYPCSTISQFYHQMRRWAKGGFSAGSNLIPIGLLFVFQNITFCLLPFKLFHYSTVVISISNFLLTWIFIIICFCKLKSNVNVFLYPFYFLFLMIESIVFISSIVFYPSLQWKGRSLHK